MAKNEVTKALWDEVRTWAKVNGYTDMAVRSGQAAADHPVQSVSWWDVIKWCNARSQKEGLTPVYTVSGAVMKTGTTVSGGQLEREWLPPADRSGVGESGPRWSEWQALSVGNRYNQPESGELQCIDIL
jgi:hypothetical protein